MIRNRRLKSISFLTLTAVFLSGCSASSSESPSSAEAQTYAAEIDKTTIMSFEISADESDWENMLVNAANEEYISADVTINGLTIENVGIRPKGNSSLSQVSQDEATDRYSFRIKFDEYVDEQTWLGLDNIVINNMFSDATYLKEYLSYDIMSDIGVATPLFAFADIMVNGEAWGFYLAVEVIDSSFLDRVYTGEGALYKPESENAFGKPDGNGFEQNYPFNGYQDQQSSAMPSAGNIRGMANNGVSLQYTDDAITSYSAIFDNAVTEADESAYQRVITAIKNLNDGTELATYVDIDAVLKYFAVHTVVVNLDSYVSNMGHNYYLYENNGQITILPWDYNMSFGGFQSSNASDIVNFPIDTPVSGVNLEDRPLLAQLLAVPEYKTKYHEYLKEIIDDYFSDGKFEQKVDALNTLISEYVKNDPTAFYTYEQYQTAIAELKELGVLRATSIQGQLDGTIPSTTEAQESDPSTLIDASTINLTDLGTQNKGNGEKPAAGAPNHGEFGGFNMPYGLDESVVRSAMDIISQAQNGTLTDEQQNQLLYLGLTSDQISQMLKMAKR